MAQEDKNQENKKSNPLDTIIISGGLNTDVPLGSQPPGTFRFAMSAVDETREGDLGTITTEESNQECYDLRNVNELASGYIPIGKVYIGNEDTLIFLANPNGDSAMIIVDRDCNVTVSVTDENQTEKFGFKVTQQIDATFRLRRGCERTVYWVDPKPRMFIFDKEEEFKVDNPSLPNFGDWDISKFNLFKSYKKIPEILDIEVLDGSGVLPPGSYNFSIRYLDADFNPTEFVSSTETIMIYNSPLTSSYRNIEGATKEEQAYYNFPNSNKAIKIEIDPNTLDTTYPFYQIAITEANKGGGLVSDTKFTSEISTRQPFFVYTGLNFQSSGSQEEVTMFNNIIEKAQSIEQIENRLILGDIEGKQLNYCKLQKYASRITADLVTKEVVVSVADSGNSKDPVAHFNGIGYMPGEIYSFGIVYIFEDNSLSPVYHIPGKSPLSDNQDMYSAGSNVYPMSNINNACETTEYIDNNTCGQDTYWGKDYTGTPLTNKPVRHHRFPLRTDYDIPFIEEIDENSSSLLTKNITIKASKVGADIPLLCPEEDTSCTTSSEQAADFGDPGQSPGGPGSVGYGAPFQIQLNYTEDSITNTYSDILDPFIYQGDVGDPQTTADVEFNFTTPTIYGTVVNVISLTEVFEDTTLNNVVSLVLSTDPITGLPQYVGTSSVTGLTYTINVRYVAQGLEEKLYKATVFGIKFSNIVLPSLADTNNQKIIGYYIVRNERKELDKTVLDSAVLLPTATERNFVSQGLLFPQYTTLAQEQEKIKKDILGFISPEHKFNNTQYASFTKIIQQGEFKKLNEIYSRVKINDVADGSSYVRGRHKSGNGDSDGFTLHIKTRDNITEFIPKTDFTYFSSDIKEVFYLNALEEKLTEDSSTPPKTKSVFNLACDNKIGIITLNQPYTQFNCLTALPYVYLYRDNTEPYSNFRLDPYYKESKNPEKFDILTGTSSCEIFNGDAYINSIRYVNSIYYNTRIMRRVGKSSVFGFILAVILVLVAVALVIFSFGAGALGAGLLIAGATLSAGVATTLTLSGIKQEAWNKAYNVLYKQGLRETITDNYLLFDVDPINGQERGFSKNPSDDEVQWLGECVNLWFESSVNMGLRNSFNDSTPSYLKAPGVIEQGTTYTEWNWEYFGINNIGSTDIDPTTALDYHMTDKLTFLDASRKDGRKYYGLALAEAYLLNPDYKRRDKQKFYNHLGLEYDCCSDCVEKFPHRWHWSEQAFQEELIDNFRIFLPNNYKDLEAETGRITDIYRIGNNLYIHTEEGLWYCPQTFQERVTGDIISFIGTGEYFSVPPRKIVDDNNSSAGNKHKWARTKTKYGVLFPSWKEKKWYLFGGEQLQPISDNGLANYFKTNMDFLIEQQFYSTNLVSYPYFNNPSNPLGVGFLSTYDTNKERLIVTKKDFKITNLPTTSFELCTEGDQTIIFTNMAQTIADREDDGWTYEGIEDCKMKFTKTEEETVNILVNDFIQIPEDMDIYVFYDTSGSFGFSRLGTGTITETEITTPSPTNLYFPTIDNSITTWINDYLIPNGWSGNLYRYYDSTERWLSFPSIIPLANRGKVLLISLTNEAKPFYHDQSIDFTGQPTTTYISDYNNFINNVYPTYDKFIGVNYSICVPTVLEPETKSFIQHSLAAVKGRNYTLEEVNALPYNLYFSTIEWTTLKSELQTNPYSTILDINGEPGLEQWGWSVKANRSIFGNPESDECPATNIEGEEVVISSCQFASDLNSILFVTEQVETTIQNFVTYIEYEEGEVFQPQFVNGSWTMSFGLKTQQWKSWHAYLPSFYFHVQEKFYSWPQGSRYIWKHNKQGDYRTFYGKIYPFIVEYVDNASPVTTKVWDYLMFQTEAKEYSTITEDYRDVRDVTFNKVLFYNTEQISGILNINTKQNQSSNYLLEQTQSNALVGNIIADRNERDWTLNDMKDIRINTTVPMFIKDLAQIQSNYYIDKIVNPAAISYFKSWNELESFRDKFLVVRLIFDNFDINKRLTFYYSYLKKEVSER